MEEQFKKGVGDLSQRSSPETCAEVLAIKFPRYYYLPFVNQIRAYFAKMISREKKSVGQPSSSKNPCLSDPLIINALKHVLTVARRGNANITWKASNPNARQLVIDYITANVSSVEERAAKLALLENSTNDTCVSGMWGRLKSSEDAPE
jgi:hypothetical protein